MFRDEEIYNVTKLTATQESGNPEQECVTPEQYNLALDCCPRVDTVVITCAGLTDDNLYRMMTLKHLQELHLGNVGGCFDFREGLEPVLDACGARIQKLVR